MKNRAYFYFQGWLEGLADTRSGVGEIAYPFNTPPSVKDAIEATRIPHTEVGLIIADGRPVGFGHILNDAARIEVYPHKLLPIGYEGEILPFMPEGVPRFILDVHLGRLARYLRVAGFDTIYSIKDLGDVVLAEMASDEGRILLTCDGGLLKRSIVTYGRLVRSRESRSQFIEVADLYGLKNGFEPFSRCIHCNGLIIRTEKNKVSERLPKGIRRGFEEFYICTDCGQVYWHGSHYSRIKQFLGEI